jgi:hypothetical protein
LSFPDIQTGRRLQKKGLIMGKEERSVRLMKEASCPEYYRMKFDNLFHSNHYLPTSLAAVKADGTVVVSQVREG